MMNLDNSKEFDVIGLGEVMLRLSPPNKERIAQGEVFEKKAGGSELNVVSGVSMLGLRTGIITKLPDNEIGYFIRNKVRFSGVSDDYIVIDEEPTSKLGIYYFESGAHPRKPSVIYDRYNSSMTTLKYDEIDNEIFKKTKIFHVSGISLALSTDLRQVIIKLIKEFKKNGTLISFDVNYRASLWDEETARDVVTSIFPYLDILFVSEETCRRMLRQSGSHEEIMQKLANEYDINIVASTKREIISPLRHNWDSIIYYKGTNEFFTEDKYEKIEVIDRIGSGDAYISGVLFGLTKYGDPQKAVEYGNAMASVKNTIPGDMSSCTFKSITDVIKSHKGESQSEMNR